MNKIYCNSGWTPLLKAVWARKEKMVQLLIEKGANVTQELRAGQHWSPLYLGLQNPSRQTRRAFAILQFFYSLKKLNNGMSFILSSGCWWS